MELKFNISWKKIGHAIKEFIISLGRGDLLTRLRVDRALPYILYLFFLGCISIWLSYHAEQTMLTVQKNNETIKTLKIYRQAGGQYCAFSWCRKTSDRTF